MAKVLKTNLVEVEIPSIRKVIKNNLIIEVGKNEKYDRSKQTTKIRR